MSANKDPGNDLDPQAPISEQASHWWVLLNSGPATPEDHKAFGEWIAGSPERVETFLETALLTKALKSGDLRWPDISVDEYARQVREAGDVAHFPRRFDEAPHAPSLMKRRIRLFAVAASVCALATGGWLLFHKVDRYETEIGELRSVVLSDGSLMMLNTASRVEVKIEKNRRGIELLQGEALFQVAKDPTRPFYVVAGNTTVRAVGTQFNVNKAAAGTTVTVVEGKVAVTSEARLQNLKLTAGEQLTVAAADGTSVAPAPEPANLSVVMAWTQRRLVFQRKPLGDVANEFNRYNTTEIQIHSAALRAQDVTGVFQANDAASFLEFVSRIPGVRIERTSDTITVFDSP